MELSLKSSSFTLDACIYTLKQTFYRLFVEILIKAGYLHKKISWLCFFNLFRLRLINEYVTKKKYIATRLDKGESPRTSLLYYWNKKRGTCFLLFTKECCCILMRNKYVPYGSIYVTLRNSFQKRSSAKACFILTKSDNIDKGRYIMCPKLQMSKETRNSSSTMKTFILIDDLFAKLKK